jgi:type IV secretory pathway VirB2 component (pilin)
MNIFPIIIIVLFGLLAWSAYKNDWDWKAGAIAIGGAFLAAAEAFKGAF